MVLQANLAIPEDGIKLQANNTRAFVGDNECGKGVLCVAESNLIWKLDNGSGLSLDYPNIALHAVSTDLTAFPHECLYLILDKNISDEKMSDAEGSEEEDVDADESHNITVIRFVPEDKALLNPLFLAMNDCQALYPDTMSNDDDEDDEEEEEEDEEADENADDGQFENGDEFENGEERHENEATNGENGRNNQC